MNMHFNPVHFNDQHFRAMLPPPSTRFGRLLVRAGDVAEILMAETSSTDDYGNPIYSYSNVCFTYVALKILRPNERFIIPGTTETAEAIGIFEPTVDIARGYRVNTLENGSWQVLYVKRMVAHGRVHHLEAYLKRVEA